MFARVISTMKTHKPEGCVVPRIIHANPNHCLASFSRYLCMHIKEGLRGCSHIYESSDRLLDVLTGLKFSRDCFFVSVDIGDFYMNGTPKVHRNCAFNHFDNRELRSILKDALHDLLSHQDSSCKL